MPRIEFIKLQKAEKARYLCDLAEEFLQAGQRVLITVMDDNQAVTLDAFMWTWNKGSFIPHAYDNGAVDAYAEPVIITTEERNANGAGVLIMGKPCSLEFVRMFDRVIDFAELYAPQLAHESRQRFARYREAGFDPRMR